MITKEKINVTIRELKGWLAKPDAKDFYYDQAIKKINEKYNETRIPKSIVVSFNTLLDVWYNNKFVYEMLTDEDDKSKSDAVANGYYTLLISDLLADQYPANPPGLLFDKVAYWLANCLSQKRYAESETILRIINKGLSTNFLKGGLVFKTTAWFIVDVANKGFNTAVDLSKFNYPEDMNVYQEALENWNNSDLKLIDSIVARLCDFHLKNATYGDGESTADIQFGDSAWFVYTFEILAWLSIREKVGLPNPESFSHPLMSLSLNKLSDDNIALPKNELAEKVLSRLRF